MEYIFREKNLNNSNDPFLTFLDCVETVYIPENTKRLNPVPRPVVKERKATEELSTEPKQLAFAPLIKFLNVSSDDDFQ